jgi:hypothetical protein
MALRFDSKKFATPYNFWNDNEMSIKFPNLKYAAKLYLSPAASTSESERLFSGAKLIVTDLRNRLSAENFRKLLLLHNNIPLI